jgi:hypothetical protein
VYRDNINYYLFDSFSFHAAFLMLFSFGLAFLRFCFVCLNIEMWYSRDGNIIRFSCLRTKARNFI